MTAPPPHLHIFLLLRTRPAWLALPRTNRRTIAAEVFAQCQAFSPDTRFRFFDAEGFSASCTDILLLKARDLRHYHFVIELLRDSPLFSEPYFDLVDIIPALEGGHQDYERHLETVA